MARVLVTGASGFLGHPLCRELRRRGIWIRGSGRVPADGPWDEFVCHDLRHPLPSRLASNVDSVFHLGGKAHDVRERPDDPEFQMVNVDGTRHAYQAAQEAGVRRFVFFSSIKAVADGDGSLLDESFDVPPSTAYGRSKREAEALVLEAGLEDTMHVAVLRPSLAYGPLWKGNLHRMFEAVRAGRFPPLPDTGNCRSMVHADDVARAALLAAERPEAHGRIYILADGQKYSTRRVYEAMCAALGKPVPRWHLPVGVLRGAAIAGDLIASLGRWQPPFDSGAMDRLIGSAWYDATRARQELGWRPLRVFEEALPEIVDASLPKAAPV